MYRFFLLIISCAVFAIDLYGQSAAKTYMNPVIPGDHADCTISKIGDHFYTTGSSFNPTPVIYHSTDLVHWEAIAQPVSASWSGYGDAPGGGCWGGHMVLHNGEYWHFFSRSNNMHYTKAPAPEGPWSMPVRVNNPSSLPYSLGYDNSIFIDDDNKWYLVVKNGQPNNGIVELGDNGQPTGVVYNLNWLNPAPSYPYSWAEGPVMWKYNGYYYYSFGRNLGGGQYVMRSSTLTAEESSWEFLGDFFNESDPQKSTSLFTSPNHVAPVVMIDDSTSWVMHPLYAKGEWQGQGRQGLLNQVRYDTSGKPIADYPINTSFAAPDLPSSGIPWMVPKSDFFNSQNLHPEWSFLGYTAANKWSLAERPGWLRLTPKSSVKGNTIIKNDGEHNYSLITRINFNPAFANDQAGLWIMRGDEQMSVKLVSTLSDGGLRLIYFSFDGNAVDIENNAGDTVWLKLNRVNHKITGYFSGDGVSWTEIGEFDISQIDSYYDFSTFTGTRQGLYVSGRTDAWFDFYIYRDAYSPILAECPANQSGTAPSTRRGGISSLDKISDNDWAMYAGVEFGTDEYGRTPDSLSVVASAFSTGGIIEVYLDSLDSDDKIAELTISNTGNWDDYETFTTALLKPVTGRHDVYLRFRGDGSDRLFMVQWISFMDTSSTITSTGSADNLIPKKFLLQQNYPNPFNPNTTINFSIPNSTHVSLIIYDLLGKEVETLISEELIAGEYSHKWNGTNVPSGIYFYRLHAGDISLTKKLVLVK